MRNFTKDVKIDPAFIYYAAGTTDCESNEFDMKGFDSITCALQIGDVTTGATVALYAEGSTATGGTFVSFYGSTASFASTQGSSGLWLVSEVYKPNKQFIKFVADRGTANAVLHGGLAFRYRAGDLAVAESTYTDYIIDYALAVNATSS